MKQSQNAITFLRSQYSAIYGRAYLKGLASVMVVGSAMMGTLTQAAENDKPWEIKGGDSWENTVNYSNQDVAPNYNSTRVESGYYNNLNADKSGATVRITNINLKGTLNIVDGATVSVTDDGTGNGPGRTIYGWDNLTDASPDTATGSLNSNGVFDVGRDGEKQSQAFSAQTFFHNIDLGSTSETGLRGLVDENQAIDDYTTLAGGYGSGAHVNVESGSIVHLKNNTQFLVAQGTSGSFNGTVNFIPNKTGTNSFIRGEDGYSVGADGSGSWKEGNAASLDFGEDSYLIVKNQLTEENPANTEQGTAGIYAANANINGKVSIRDNTTLRLDGDFIDTTKNAATAGHGAGNFVVGQNAIINIRDEGSRLVVGNGSYDVDNPNTVDVDESRGETTVDLTAMQAGNLKGEGVLEVQGTTILTESVLDGLVTPSAQAYADTPNESANWTKGGKVALNDGTLEVKTENDQAFNLNKYILRDTETLGSDIVIGSGDNLIKSTHIDIDKRLEAVNAKEHLSFEANKLTLGGDKGSNLNFKQALVHDEVHFEQPVNGTGTDKRFLLHDSVIVNAVGNNNNDTALSSGDVVVVSSENFTTPTKYQVAGGTVNHSGNFAANWGSEIIVGGAAEAAGDPDSSLHDAISTAIGHDATLKVTPIDDDGAGGVDKFRISNATLKIQGNGSGATSTVDLTNLSGDQVAFDKTSGDNNAKINIGTDYAVGSPQVSDARLVINDTHLEKMFNLARGIRTTVNFNENSDKGATVILGQSGVLEIHDDPNSNKTYSGQIEEQTDGRVQLDVSLLKDASAGTDTNNYIYFKDGGRIEADKLQLMQESMSPDTNSASPILNIGKGTVAANDLQIRNSIANSDIVVSNGTLEAGKAFSSADANTALVLGDANTSAASGGAHLNLGSVKYQSVADENGLHNNTYKYVSGSATESGSINANVVLNGKTKDDASLNIRVGKWTVGESGSFSFASGGHGTINVGMDASEVLDPSQPVSAELELGKDLTVTTGNAFNIKDTGIASIDTFKVESGASTAIDGMISFNSGDLSVSGAEITGHGQINVGGVPTDTAPDGTASGHLAINKTQLESYLGTGVEGEAAEHGHILFRTDSTLDLTSEPATNQIELGAYSLATQADANTSPTADLNLVEGKHLDIRGNNLSISAALTEQGAPEANVDVYATDLSLGGKNGFTSSSQELGVKTLNTQNVTFVGDKDASGADLGTGFTLRDELNLAGSDNGLFKTGTSTGDVTVGVGGEYHVQDGAYTHSGKFNLAGGTVTIDRAEAQGTSPLPVSSLTVSGDGINIDNTKGANTIKLAGTAGSLNSAALDLSNGGDLTLTRGDNLTTIDVGTESQFVVTGQQATELLKGPADPNTPDSGAGVILADSAEMVIKGDNTLDVGTFQSGDAAQSDKIVFNNGGEVTINGTTTLTNTNGQSMALGQGTVNANGGVVLSGDAVTPENNNFVLAQGTLNVGNTAAAQGNNALLSGDVGTSFTVGDGTTSGDAVLNLNGTDSTQQFAVNADLGLNGNGDNHATVNLDKGQFTAQNINVSGANNTINVGNATNAATLAAQDLNVADNSTLTVNSGAASVNDATLGSGSTLNLNNESLEITGNGDFSSGTLAGTADLTVNGDAASASIQAQNFVDYLSGGANVTLQSGGDLNLVSSTQVDLTQFAFDDGAVGASGDIHVIDDNDPQTANSRITGEDLILGHSLHDTDLALDVQATKLTLGESTYDSASDTNGLGVDKLYAQDVTFVGYTDPADSTTSDFVLRDELNLRAPPVTSGVEPDITTTTGTGTITGNVVLAGGTDNGLNVLEGNYTQNNNVTLASGSLTVGGDTNATTDASLTVNGDFKLDNTSGNNVINVHANGAGTEATLDLSQATAATVTPDTAGTNLTTINVGSTPATPATPPVTDSHVKVTAELANNLLSGDAGAVNLGASGELDIGSGDVTLATGDLLSGATAAAGQIAFNNGGVLSADGLNLSGNSDLNIGAGTINANSLDFNNTTPDTDATFAGGNFNIANELSSTNTNIVVGNGSNTANVTLGAFTPDPTDPTNPDTAVVSGSLGGNPGTISSNVVVNANASLNVQQGNWTLNNGSGNLTVNQGELVIGAVNDAGNAYQVYDDQGSGTAVTAEITGNALNLSGADITVNSTGTANFDSLSTDATSGSNILVAGGTINVETDVSLNSGDSIVISGATGTVSFGSGAAHHITANANGTTLDVVSGSFDNVFDLQSGGNLKLDLGDQTFSLAQIQELRKTLLADADPSGSVMDPGEHGYIWLGGAQVNGLGSGGAGGMTEVPFDNYDPVTGEFTPVPMGGTAGAEGQILSLSMENRDAMDLLADIKDIRTDLTDDILLYDINTDSEGDVVTGNVGALMVNDGTHAEINDATLAHAYDNGQGNNSGNRYFIADQATGDLLGANIQSGGILNLENGGYIGEVTLEDGNSVDDLTTLTINTRDPNKTYGSGDDGITHIEGNVSGGANTAFNVHDETIVSGAVTIGQLNNTADLTVNGGAITVSGGTFGNSGTIALNNADVSHTGGDFTNSGTISGANNVTVAGGNISLGETSSITASGSGSFSGNTVAMGGTNAFGGDVTVTGTDVSFASGSSLSTSSGNVTVTGDSLNFGDNTSISTASGNLAFTANTGDISLGTGSASFSGNSISFTANSGDITLGAGSQLQGDSLSLTGLNVDIGGNQTFTGSGNFTATDPSGAVNIGAGNQSFDLGASFAGANINLASGANISASSGNVSFDGALVQEAGSSISGIRGTFNGNSATINGTVNFTGYAAAQSGETANTTIAFNSKDITLNQGANVTATQGNILVGAPTAADDSTFTMASGSTISGGGNVFLNNATNKVAGTIRAGENLYVNGDNNTIEQGALLVAKDANFNGTTDFSGKGVFDGSLKGSGNINISTNGAIYASDVSMKGKLTNQGILEIGQAYVDGQLAILNTGKIDTLELADANSLVTVGMDSFAANDNTGDTSTGGSSVAANSTTNSNTNTTPIADNTNNANGLGEVTNRTGRLEINDLKLNGGTLFVDPEYGHRSSTVALNADGGKEDVLDGNLIVGKNSAVSWGQSIETLEQDIAVYQDANGSLSNEGKGYGAILVLNQPLKIADGAKVILDSNASYSSLDQKALEELNGIDSLALTPNGDNTYTSDADLQLMPNTALVVKGSNITTADGAAIQFATSGAQVLSSGGTIVVTGDYDVKQALNLFSDADAAPNNGVEITGQDLEVTTQSGLFNTTLKSGTTVGTVQLALDNNAVDNWGGSDESKDTIKDYFDTTNPNYNQNNNQFIEDVATSSTDGSALDQARRLGVFGGTAQTALAVSDTTTRAMQQRAGMMQNTDPTAADSANLNTAGTAQFWVNPVYVHQDSDGFSAGSQSYGSDMDLYGLNAGAEFKVSPSLRLGAMVNIGSGSTEGNGAASGVSNDFNYYGVGAYVAADVGQSFSVMGDVSYTKISNDVSAHNSLDNLSASPDSTNISAGVMAKVNLSAGGLNVAPYIGVRYQHLDLDGYDVGSTQYGNVAQYSSDTTDIWSLPVGVNISKELITASGWQLKPEIDLQLKANLGDEEVNGDVKWAGTNLTQNVSSEVVDPFSYGVAAGINAKKGNFSVGVGINYTGSENTNEFGVNANMRYDF